MTALLLCPTQRSTQGPEWAWGGRKFCFNSSDVKHLCAKLLQSCTATSGWQHVAAAALCAEEGTQGGEEERRRGGGGGRGRTNLGFCSCPIHSEGDRECTADHVDFEEGSEEVAAAQGQHFLWRCGECPSEWTAALPADTRQESRCLSLVHVARAGSGLPAVHPRLFPSSKVWDRLWFSRESWKHNSTQTRCHVLTHSGQGSMWYAWLLLKAATVPGMTKEDYLMSCLSQYLGDTPGIQVFLCSLRSACALPCFSKLPEHRVWRGSKAERPA